MEEPIETLKTNFTDQVSLLHLGMTFKSPDSIFATNFAPLFFFIGYRILKTYDLVGKKISIKPFKANSSLTSIEGEQKFLDWGKVRLK